VRLVAEMPAATVVAEDGSAAERVSLKSVPAAEDNSRPVILDSSASTEHDADESDSSTEPDDPAASKDSAARKRKTISNCYITFYCCYYIHLTASFPGQPGARKVKAVWI